MAKNQAPELREYLVRIDHFVDATSPEEAARSSLDWLQDTRVEVSLQVNHGKRWWDVVLPQDSGEEFSVTEVQEDSDG